MLKFFNTLSEKKESLKPRHKKRVQLFVCGPTVYDYSHIGHARTYLAFDCIAKYLSRIGYKTYYLQNITDIDDKIIERAKQQHTTPKTLARMFEKLYHEDERKLRITSITKYARATDYIPAIVRQVKTLLKRGHAYEIRKDGYYFDLATFPRYGALSRRTSLQAEDAVSRIDESLQKRNKGDFALWKFSKRGEPYWNTELGKGRPGWHIEDTAITESIFGPQYDIHGGAIDLKFPHHEAEIAQQESASRKHPLAKYWLHTGFLTINGKKMSKSAGNFVTIRDFLSTHENAALPFDATTLLRYFILSQHYRAPIDFNEALITHARQSLITFLDFEKRLSSYAGKTLKMHQGEDRRMTTVRNTIFKQFEAALENDFNTPQALGVIFDAMHTMNSKMDTGRATRNDVIHIRTLLTSLYELFDLRFRTVSIPKEVKSLVTQRESARKEKQWQRADMLRVQTSALGFSIEDTPQGPIIHPTYQ
ncbi:MAG: cysteine--tRNA ligase [Patescibacteria group bacterium]|nr:cysteine--tRNA ligase [Patescibacteria group bacterium]MDE2438587.1 cysteine--tRNA ligase [Patescibacteria group bacterium]